MSRILRSAVALAVCVSVVAAPAVAEADPIGDFFKRIGRSIAPRKAPAKSSKRKSKASSGKTKPATKGEPGPTPAEEQTPAPLDDTPTFTPEPTATPTPPPTRVASAAPASLDRRDLPYGVPVPGRPGFVTSPYAPTRGLVDVRAFQRGAEVKDPYSGKVFLTP